MAGKTRSGVVSNRGSSFKVYKIIKPYNLTNSTDLSVEVTPCKGLVAFYYSNSFEDIFSQKNKQDIDKGLSEEIFGK